MLKLLFCCWMNSSPEPVIEIEIIQPPSSPIVYRPSSRVPFTEQDLKFFQDIRNQKKLTSTAL